MAWAHQQSTKGISEVLAFVSDVQAGTLLIAAQGYSPDEQVIVAPTDTRGNTWTRIGVAVGDAPNNQAATWWWAVSNGAGANTVTFDPGSSFDTYIIAEYLGPGGTIVLEDSDGQLVASTSASADGVSAPNVTVSSSDALVLGFIQNTSSADTWTEGTGFTERQEQTTPAVIQLEDKGSGSGSIAVTWTLGVAGEKATAFSAAFGVTGGAAQNQLAWIRA